jgi:aspartate kinase
VANLTFTVGRDEAAKAQHALEPVLAALGGGEVTMHENIVKLSVVGVGMKTHAGVAAKLFQALAKAQINIEMISTSEIKISVVIDEKHGAEATRATHAAFGLDKPA